MNISRRMMIKSLAIGIAISSLPLIKNNRLHYDFTKKGLSGKQPPDLMIEHSVTNHELWTAGRIHELSYSNERKSNAGSMRAMG